MITLILRDATAEQLRAARCFTATHLHITSMDVPSRVAVAYICQHFEEGDYSGWDGFIEMREADSRG